MYQGIQRHGHGCACPSCQEDEHLGLSDSPLKWLPIPGSVQQDFITQVYNLSVNTDHLHQPLFDAHYNRLRSWAEAGYGKSFTNPADLAEWEAFDRYRRNLAEFAAFKQNNIIEDLRNLRYRDGKRVPLAEFEEQANKLMRRQHSYLRTEVKTIRRSANMAERWTEMQRRAYLYPNVRYETVGDSRVREEHRDLDGAVYPINHEFWDTHWPPNGWNCRCTTIQTDEPVNEIEPGWTPGKGFRQNPGKTGMLIGEDHPYYDYANQTQSRIRELAQQLRAVAERDELYQVAKTALAGKSLAVPGLPGRLEMSARSIKSIQRHYHEVPDVRNSLLTILEWLLPTLNFVGTATNDDPAKGTTRRWFYYRVILMGQDFVLNIREVQAAKNRLTYQLYAITTKA